MGLFRKDQMTITLDKYDYTPGDTIKGMLMLSLRKPLQARKLTIAMLGIRTDVVMTRTTDSHGHSQMRSQKVQNTIYNFEMPLDGETIYMSESYHFDIKIPENLFQTVNISVQPAATIELFGQKIPISHGQPLSSSVEWCVDGQLDLPMKLDVHARQKIVLSPK